MNYRIIGKYVSKILALEIVLMLPAIVVAMLDRDINTIVGFLYTYAIILVIVGILYFLCKGAKSSFSSKEGMLCVGLSWIVMSILGCLPFYFTGAIPNFVDALFETVSGFTTTGASILSDVEALSRGLLYWRSFTHWIGGMGVLVFLLALARSEKSSGGFTVHLLRAESPGPEVNKLVPHIKDTSIILYFMYIFLTVLNIIFLLIGGMPIFDSLCIAFGTAGTGGFGILNDSIASYSPYIQNVCTVFMLLFGINFSCYFLLILRRFKEAFKDEELRLYLGIILGSIIAIVINIRHLYPTLEETIRHGAFQVVSIITTTGYVTTDFDLWPGFAKGILLCLMVVGACAGSTGGGLKCGRLLLLVKSLKRNINQVLNPNRVQLIKHNGQSVKEKVITNTHAYLAAYVIIIIISFIIVSWDGFSIGTNVSAVVSCFNNIGPGFESVGATCNFGGFGIVSKLTLIVDMLAGRLEIFPILALLTKSAWEK